MTNFAAWWRDFGSAMRPGPNEDTEEFVMRVASSAWHNSADAAFTACEAACDQIEDDKWALYKGRPPYTGQEAGRADDFTQGQADGAALCLDAIDQVLANITPMQAVDALQRSMKLVESGHVIVPACFAESR